MPSNNLIITIALIGFPLYGFSQFVNEGQLYISSGTNLSLYCDVLNKSEGDYVNDGNVYYYKNLYNKGIITFTNLVGGNTYFVGKEQQIIQTDLESEFYNIIFENASLQPAFHLNGDISVASRAVFNRGIIKNSSFDGKFTFKKNADHLNASDISFIDGKVSKLESENFIFPIGNKGYLMKTELTSSKNIDATTQYFFENSNPIFLHSKKNSDILIIDDAQYWNIISMTGEKNIISLEWRTETTSTVITEPLNDSEIKIVGWNKETNKWEVQIGTKDNQSNKITAMISHAGIYTLARVKIKDVFPEDIEIFNGISPNNDGVNDIFFIKNIDKYPENSLEIYNRSGILVYETKSYGISENWFNGISKGNISINNGKILPSGTYFYILKLKKTNGNTIDKTGYLYIN